MSKVSIIVPIYNVEKYLPKCLDSLINQTFKEIEILAIVDGSPDNSLSIVKEYQKKDKRIKCIEKENGGYGSVLEYAIKIIKTEYFLICDSDDWLALDAIAKLYNFAKSNNLDLYIADKYVVYENDNKLGTENLFVFDKKLIPNKIYKNKEVHKFVSINQTPHAKLFKTSICENINFPHKVNYTDFILYIMAVSNSERIAYTNEKMAYYLKYREGNSTTDKSLKTINDRLIVQESLINQLSKYNNNYAYYRIYIYLKGIIHLYSKISTNLFKDKYFEDIVNQIKKIQKYKIEIINAQQEKNFLKIFLILLFHNKTQILALKSFIFITKLLKK